MKGSDNSAEVINGYILQAPLDTNNAGNCKWGFAVKNGRKYFIKEFLDPVYPVVTDGLSENIVNRKISICRKYEYERTELYKRINGCADGGLQYIEEFFRCGSHYYMTMQAINELNREAVLRSGLSLAERIKIARVLIHNLACLHSQGMVHADIKLDNIVFFRLPEGRISARIIDFDDVFYENSPPEYGEDVHGDQVYMAPETFRFICGSGEKLTCAIDTFALGLLLYQLFNDFRLPHFDMRSNRYVFEAMLNGTGIYIDRNSLPGYFGTLVPAMLQMDPARRISLIEADHILHGETGSEPASDPDKGKNQDPGPNGIYPNQEPPDYRPPRIPLDGSDGLKVSKGLENIFVSSNDY